MIETIREENEQSKEEVRKNLEVYLFVIEKIGGRGDRDDVESSSKKKTDPERSVTCRCEQERIPKN